MAGHPPTTRNATRASDLSSASAAPPEDESLSADTALLLATSDDSREPARHASPLVVLLFVVLAAAAALVAGLLMLDDRDRSPRGVAVGLRSASPSAVARPSPMQVAPPPVAPLPVARAPDPTPSVFVVQSPVPAPPSPEPTPAAPALPLALTPSIGGNGADLFVLGAGWTPGTTVVLDYLDVDGAQTGSRASAVVDPQGGFGVELLAEDPSDRTGRHVVRVSDGSRTQDVPYDVE